MKKKTFLLSLLTLLLVVFFTIPVSASAKTDAVNAYKKYLTDNRIVYGTYHGHSVIKKAGIASYAFIYFNNDSIPELVANWTDMTKPCLYTYKNGKVQAISNSYSEPRWEILGYYKKKGVFVKRYESNGYPYHAVTTIYLKQKGTKLIGKQILSEYKSGTKNVKTPEYYLYGSKQTDPFDLARAKKVSKSKYSSNLKKLTGSAKMSKIKYITNS